MEIEFDPEKAAENQRKHGVSFAHAEQVLRDPLAVTIEDPDAEQEPRFVTLGMDSVGWGPCGRSYPARGANTHHLRPEGKQKRGRRLCERNMTSAVGNVVRQFPRPGRPGLPS